MNVVIYARFSSHSQTEQSIEGQLKVCSEYAAANNYVVVGEYIDRAQSGTTDNRSEFQQMIADSDRHTFESVFVYQLDRFARNRYDSAINKAKLKKNGVRVISAKENISDDASGILVEGVLESMAEYYSVELSQKIHRGMKINAEKCLSNGSNPGLGYKGEETPGGMPQIVDVELFERVQNILDRNKAAPARSRGKQEYILTTKLFCGHCKEMMTGYTGTGKHGNKYHYYICNGAKKKVCHKKTIHKDLIEERVVDACSKLLTKEKVKYIADQVYAACKKDGDLLSVKRLKTALKETESAIENLWVAMEKGQSVEMITERINKREAEKKELEKQLGIEIKKQSGMEYSDILSFLDYLRLLPNDNEYKRRALINIFINAIYLYDRYFTLILNAGNRPISIENIPLDDIEETFANDYEGCSFNSLLVADAPPMASCTNTRQLFIWLAACLY